MTATFKDLCIDAVDPLRMQAFWAATLGLRPESRGPDNLLLTGSRPEHTVWVNKVPEPHQVKGRVHLDVNTASIAELVDRGARVLDDSHRWTIMADPEGNEFCGFVREPGQLTDYRVYELGVDATEPRAIAGWWARQFGVEVKDDGAAGDGTEEWCWIEGGSLPFPMVFARVPEPKTVKNRVHWDVLGETQRFLDAGASLLRSADEENFWDVLADPEGNEFCVFGE
ncbi:MAG TPA: VOC family protein [Microlunatus sp.]|nr:VOC family protein [Microlunatus sp.]